MRILVAPDKFKGTLTAAEAGAAIRTGLHTVDAAWQIDVLPFADGGDGTVDAVIAVGAELRFDSVSGPLGVPVIARWAILDGTAIIETAEACGLRHVAPSPETARAASSRGVGELMLRALDAGCRRIVLGIGGSASTDAGAGALVALGAQILGEKGSRVDDGGAGLGSASVVDLAGMDPRIAESDILLCADVLSPYAGHFGAAEVYGPQKGADAGAVADLAHGLRTFARAIATATGLDLENDLEGGGAGGMVGGLRAGLGARPVRGVDLVADLLGLDEHLDGCSAVIVGEGSLDDQSVFGKAPVGIAERARDRGIPALAVAGVSTLDPVRATEHGIAAIVSAAEIAGSAAAAMDEPRRWVEAAGAECGRWIGVRKKESV